MYRILTLILVLALAAGILLIPDWFKDPREWALGAWQDKRNQVIGTVDGESVRWQGPGRRGRLTYQWKQTEQEPYQIEFYWGELAIPADVTFHGRDEVVVEPHIMHLLDAQQRELVEEANKAQNRQPHELRFQFKRIPPEDADADR